MQPVDARAEYFDEGETVPLPDLVAARREALHRLLGYARRELPFYRDLWDGAGRDPEDPIDEEAFRRLPLTRKRDLVRAFEARRTNMIGIEALIGLDPRNTVMTSGTMGFNTFATVTDHDLDGPSTLAQGRELWMIGVRPGMRVLSLSPAWHALGLFESRALTMIGAVPVLPWGTLTPRFVGDILNAIIRLRPEHLLVTARALRMLLAECERLHLDSEDAFASVRLVGCAGESLSPAFRAHVQSRLGAEAVFERGGSSDGMFGGGECFAHRGHHISADVHFVEIVDPRTGLVVEDGERGTAVVTNLTLGKSVYIRFDTEDVAEIVPGDCPCGRTHPVVEFHARLADSVVLPDRIITPADVGTVLDEFGSIRFRPFSVTWDDLAGLQVSVGGQPDVSTLGSVPEVAAALEARLGVRATLSPGTTVAAGWKEERVTRGGDSG